MIIFWHCVGCLPYAGHVRDMFCVYYGHGMDIFGIRFEHAMDMFRPYNGYAMQGVGRVFSICHICFSSSFIFTNMTQSDVGTI